MPAWKTAMRTLVLAIALLALAHVAVSGPAEQTYRKTLDQPQTIQSYPCDKGYAWFYADGRLERCTISRDVLFGELAVPARSIIQLLPDGSPKYAMLVRNTLINGLPCAGGGPLGPGEGATIELYPSGKFRLCFLTQDQVVQGVPCVRGGMLRALAGLDVPVEFYESGKLKGCLLTAEYGGLHSGDRFAQEP
jgi:hypothetical protein